MDVVPIREAARLLNRNYKTVYYHFSQGRIPATRAGGVWLVRVDDVRNAVEMWQSAKARNSAK